VGTGEIWWVCTGVTWWASLGMESVPDNLIHSELCISALSSRVNFQANATDHARTHIRPLAARPPDIIDEDMCTLGGAQPSESTAQRGAGLRDSREN